MKTEYRIIRPDGLEETHEVKDWPEQPEYGQIREVLNKVFGEESWPEHVNVLSPETDEYTDMFVDEDGRAKGLPHNPKATAIYQYNTLKNCPGANQKDLWDIVGTAVVFNRRIWF